MIVSLQDCNGDGGRPCSQPSLPGWMNKKLHKPREPSKRSLRISPRKSHQLRPHLAVAARNQADTAAPPHGQGQHGIGQQAASMKTQRQVELLERAEGNKNLRGQFGLAWRGNCEKIHWRPKRSTNKNIFGESRELLWGA